MKKGAYGYLSYLNISYKINMENLNIKKTYSEVYEILNILGEDFINKVPRKLYNLID